MDRNICKTNLRKKNLLIRRKFIHSNQASPTHNKIKIENSLNTKYVPRPHMGTFGANVTLWHSCCGGQEGGYR